MIRLHRGALVLALAGTAWTSAQAGLFDDEEARRAILEMRQRIDANKVASDRQADEQRRATDELRRSLLQLQQQIETLRSEQATLRGQNEQATRDLSELQRAQREGSRAVDERLRKVEAAKTPVIDEANPAAATVPGGSEQQEFDAALAAFRQGRFAEAQTSFGQFVRRYPQSASAPDALFWLGNAQFANRGYREAIGNFRAMLTQAPNHARAPEAALAIANSQLELKDTKAARTTLENLLKAYPQSEAAVAAKERLARLR